MISSSVIFNYFPDTTETSRQKIEGLYELYHYWNAQINVISRKDIDELYLRHVLHSLSIAKFTQFNTNQKVLDIGTGGGFPGIPLAIMFPETDFILADSIGKKITVVKEVSQALGLTNVYAVKARVEEIPDTFDYAVTRAVAPFPELYHWIEKKIKASAGAKHQIKPGLIALKGGDLTEELTDFPKCEVHPLSKWFKEDFFETKQLVYLPMV